MEPPNSETRELQPLQTDTTNEGHKISNYFLTKTHLAVGLSVTVIVIILSSTLIVYTTHSTSLTVHANYYQPSTDSRENRTQNAINNNTPGNKSAYKNCGFQYKLKFERIWISVCYLKKTPVIDIRQFINNRPSIKGIQLSVPEWKSFLDLISKVNYIVDNGHTV